MSSTTTPSTTEYAACSVPGVVARLDELAGVLLEEAPQHTVPADQRPQVACLSPVEEPGAGRVEAGEVEERDGFALQRDASGTTLEHTALQAGGRHVPACGPLEAHPVREQARRQVQPRGVRVG